MWYLYSWIDIHDDTLLHKFITLTYVYIYDISLIYGITLNDISDNISFNIYFINIKWFSFTYNILSSICYKYLMIYIYFL